MKANKKVKVITLRVDNYIENLIKQEQEKREKEGKATSISEIIIDALKNTYEK